MPDHPNGKSIGVILKREEEWQRFYLVKEHYAFHSDASVLRFLIAQEARRLEKREEGES